uniref:Uncharacterized protein n=1 Tax=Anguilla anguilla TaxID=7936 RepID=A0A0E9QWX0_ANGAN
MEARLSWSSVTSSRFWWKPISFFSSLNCEREGVREGKGEWRERVQV